MAAIRGQRAQKADSTALSSDGNIMQATLWTPVEFTFSSIKVKALVIQPWRAFCDPIDCSPPGSSVHRILQVKILEWVAIPLSRGTSQPKDWTQVSCIAGGFFTIWAMMEAQGYCSLIWNNMKFSTLAKHFESVNPVKEPRSMQVIFLCFKMWNI